MCVRCAYILQLCSIVHTHTLTHKTSWPKTEISERVCVCVYEFHARIATEMEKKYTLYVIANWVNRIEMLHYYNANVWCSGVELTDAHTHMTAKQLKTYTLHCTGTVQMVKFSLFFYVSLWKHTLLWCTTFDIFFSILHNTSNV